MALLKVYVSGLGELQRFRGFGSAVFPARRLPRRHERVGGGGEKVVVVWNLLGFCE